MGYLDDSATAFGADDRVVRILKGLQFVVANVGEVVGMNSARGQANDDRPCGCARNGSLH